MLHSAQVKFCQRNECHQFAKVEDQTEVFNEKTVSFFNRLNNKNKFEVIFFDPPFAESFFIDELKAIKIASIYKKNHLVIIHREEKSEDQVEKILNILLTKKYGRSKVIFGTF